MNNQLPANGAKIGAKPMTNISIESRLGLCGWTTVALMARLMTMPAQPPKPCTKRPIINSFMVLAKLHVNEAMTNKLKPTNKGGLRPKRSLNEPYNTCPSPYQ